MEVWASGYSTSCSKTSFSTTNVKGVFFCFVFYNICKTCENQKKNNKKTKWLVHLHVFHLHSMMLHLAISIKVMLTSHTVGFIHTCISVIFPHPECYHTSHPLPDDLTKDRSCPWAFLPYD